MRRRLLLGLLLLALAPAPAARADILHLKSGRQIRVQSWWVEGAMLYFKSATGTVGIPREDVESITPTKEPPAPTAPAEKGAAPSPSRQATDAEAAPAEKPATPLRPSAAELDRLIERFETDYRHAGSNNDRLGISAKLADLLVARARIHREKGEESAARDAYDRALNHVPAHPLALQDSALMELNAGQPERALSLVQVGLVAHPDDPSFLLLRGEILYRDNRLSDALSDFTMALEKLPDNAVLKDKIDKIRREQEAERQYVRKDSHFFTLRFDGDHDRELSQLLIEALEKEYRDLSRELNPPPGPPINVILYTQRMFQETTGSGDQVLGLFDGKVRLPVGGVRRITPGLTRIIRHELVHAMITARARGATVPRWYHEGLAQLLEPRPADLVFKKLREDATLLGGRVSIDPFSYPKALAFVAWLESRFSRSRLFWFLDQLADGADENQALAYAFGAPREELNEGFSRWLIDRE